MMTTENVGVVLMVGGLPVRVRVRQAGLGVSLEYQLVVAIDSNLEVTQGLILKEVLYRGTFTEYLQDYRVCVNLDALPEAESNWAEIAYFEKEVGGPDFPTYAAARVERAETIKSNRRFFKGIGTALAAIALYGGYKLLKR